MVEVRNDIPIPGTARPRRHPNYPWRTMSVVDSFFVDKRETAITGCYQMALRLGRAFIWRDEVGEVYGVKHAGARVWRTE